MQSQNSSPETTDLPPLAAIKVRSSSPRFPPSTTPSSTPTPTSLAQRKIGIAVDLSDESAFAVKWAVHQYLRPGDAVILIHVRPTSVLYGADWGSVDLSIVDSATRGETAISKTIGGKNAISESVGGESAISESIGGESAISESIGSESANSGNIGNEETQRKLEDDFDTFTITKAKDLSMPLVEGDVPFKIHIVKDHDMKERLCLEVERLGLSALVMGSRGFGATKRGGDERLGSVSDYCVRHCVCPVVVVRYPDEKDEGRGSGEPIVRVGSVGEDDEEMEYHDATDHRKG